MQEAELLECIIMTEQFKILNEEYVSYTGGTAFLIGNENIQFHVWETKEDSETVCRYLNSLIDKNEQLESKLNNIEKVIDKHIDYWANHYDLVGVDVLQKVKKEIFE